MQVRKDEWILIKSSLSEMTRRWYRASQKRFSINFRLEPQFHRMIFTEFSPFWHRKSVRCRTVQPPDPTPNTWWCVAPLRLLIKRYRQTVPRTESGFCGSGECVVCVDKVRVGVRAGLKTLLWHCTLTSTKASEDASRLRFAEVSRLALTFLLHHA